MEEDGDAVLMQPIQELRVVDFNESSESSSSTSEDGEEVALLDEQPSGEQPASPGITDLVKGAPRDFWVVIILVFFESFAYFSVTTVFMMTLEEEYGMNDVESSSTYAMFGLGVSMHSILFGWVVDKLRVRKSLLLHVVLLGIGKIAMGLFPYRPVLWIMMMGPISFSLSIGGTAVMVAIRRYTNVESRSVGFSLRYISMNMGAFVASPVADLVRTEFVPAMEKMDVDGFSLFIAITGVIHLLDTFLVYYWIRDVYVPEGEPCLGVAIVGNGEYSGTIEIRSLRWPLRYVDPAQREDPAEALPAPINGNRRSCGDVMRAAKARIKAWWQHLKKKVNRSLVGLAVLTFGVLGAKSVFRFLDSLYPLYMERAPYPVPDPSAVPYLSFLVIDPLLVMICTAPVSNFIAQKQFHPYWVIMVGVCISGLAPFFMLIVHYWAVIAFIVTMSLAEIIWSPMLATYACWFAPQGEEGVYLALSALPVFAAKGGAGVLSGEILNHYCPANGDTCHPVIWAFVGALAASSPLIIGVAYKLVKIDQDDPEVTVAEIVEEFEVIDSE